MNDLISRSALIAHIGDLGIDPEDDTTFLTTGQACAIAHKCIVEMVKEEPAVDAVVLPVKPGDVVWILNHKFAAEIEEIRITEDGVFAVWVEFDKYPEETEVWDDGEFDIKEIGKTVFLSVEDWEKAMYPCKHCFSGTYRSCDGCSYGERRGDE